ncbi:hypothetical protein BJX61DRAFT_541574 [Aspergillus egyptiacus]|nr:hypothetical protein BJX61DRAFT_541574 [Aspergillus egyptiacus]
MYLLHLLPTLTTLLTLTKTVTSNPFSIAVWPDPDCLTQSMSDSEISKSHFHFDETRFRHNVTAPRVSYSFTLSRPLRGGEQLDISVARDLGSWGAGSGEEASCSEYVGSYFESNTAERQCYNGFGPFTCFHLWVNTDLPGFKGVVPVLT